MKESVLDVLIYLFENFMSSEKVDFEPESEEISTRLEDAGFNTTDVDRAIQWVLDLKENVISLSSDDFNSSIRIFSVDEQHKISPAIRHTLHCMERDEIITPSIRELIIDRVMALDLEEVDIDQLKWIMLFVLCFQGQMAMQVKRLEDVILLDNPDGTLH